MQKTVREVACRFFQAAQSFFNGHTYKASGTLVGPHRLYRLRFYSSSSPFSFSRHTHDNSLFKTSGKALASGSQRETVKFRVDISPTFTSNSQQFPAKMYVDSGIDAEKLERKILDHLKFDREVFGCFLHLPGENCYVQRSLSDVSSWAMEDVGDKLLLMAAKHRTGVVPFGSAPHTQQSDPVMADGIAGDGQTSRRSSKNTNRKPNGFVTTARVKCCGDPRMATDFDIHTNDTEVYAENRLTQLFRGDSKTQIPRFHRQDEKNDDKLVCQYGPLHPISDLLWSCSKHTVPDEHVFHVHMEPRVPPLSDRNTAVESAKSGGTANTKHRSTASLSSIASFQNS